jgi:hypothetical protein
MKQRAPRSADDRPARRDAPDAKTEAAAIVRTDQELPDGRYLLVYSKAATPDA